MHLCVNSSEHLGLLWMSLLKCLVDDREKWKAGQMRSQAGDKSEAAPSTNSPIDDAFLV